MPPVITFSHSAVTSIGGSSGVKTFSHSFSGSGAASVMILRGANHTNEVSAVSIGGQALTRLFHEASFTPSRHAEIWATETGVPSGSQTVSITYPDTAAGYAVATDVSVAGGIPEIGPTGSSQGGSSTYSTSLDSGADEALGIACMVITDPSGSTGSDQSYISGAPFTTDGRRYHFSQEDTQNTGSRNNGFGGNNPHAGGGMLWLGVTDDEVIEPDPPGAEVGIPTGFTVTGSSDVVLYAHPFGIAGAKVGIPSGFRVTAEGPTEVYLAVPYRERPQTTDPPVGDGVWLLRHRPSAKARWEQLTSLAAEAGLGSSDLEDLHIDTSVSGAHDADRDDAPNHLLTLTGDATITPVSTTYTAGLISLLLLIQQDGTGGWTLDWDNVTWTDGEPDMPTGPGEMLVVSVFSWDDGATWLGVTPGGGGSAPDGAVAGYWQDDDPGTPSQDETIWYDTDEDSPVESGESQGTAWPPNPLNGTRFKRTDLLGGTWWVWDSSHARWLSETIYVTGTGVSLNQSADFTLEMVPLPNPLGLQVVVVWTSVSYFQNTGTFNASNHWDVTFDYARDGLNAVADIVGGDIDGATASGGVVLDTLTAFPNYLITDWNGRVQVTFDEQGAAGNFYGGASIGIRFALEP